MKKDNIRDYATGAFVRYANLGYPTRDEYEERIRSEVYTRLSHLEPKIQVFRADAEISKREPILQDIDAVEKTLQLLRSSEKDYIADAVEEVYFVEPSRLPKRSEICDRVNAFCAKYHFSERSVYYYLKMARELFAMFRGLYVDL